MQTSLSPPWTYAVYLIDYPDGSYADSTEPYTLEIFLLPSGLRDALALVTFGFQIFTYSAWSFRIHSPAYHEAVSVDSIMACMSPMYTHHAPAGSRA